MKLKRRTSKRESAVNQDVLGHWVPKTEIGRLVKEGKITSMDGIISEGKRILESEIVDSLLPSLQQEMIELASTQRVTDSGRKISYRSVIVVGDEERFVGVGQGKADEVRPSIETALRDAKLKVIPVVSGCGSWECGCGLKHSIPIKIIGGYGGVEITLKPAPRGTDIVANPIVKHILTLAGIKDVWTRAKGRTRNRYNTAMAVINALDQLNKMRIKEGTALTEIGTTGEK